MDLEEEKISLKTKMLLNNKKNISGFINTSALYAIIFTILSVILAFIVGNTIADNNYVLLSAIGFVFITILILVSCGDKYWIFVPLSAGFTGSFSFLHLPLSVQELGCCAAFGLFVITTVFKKNKSYAKTDWIDLIIAINFFYLMLTWARHPVGFNSTGGEMVGGRSYVTILLSFLGYLVLRGKKASAKLSFALPALILLPHFLLDMVNLVSQVYPSVGTALLPIYTGVEIGELTGATNDADDTRFFALGKFGRTIIQSLVSYFPPATLLSPQKIGLTIPFIIAFILVGLSGFRSELIASFSFTGLSSLLRNKVRDAILMLIIAIITTLIISTAFTFGAKIPFSIQRALSFVPLEWDQRAIKSGNDTAEWRFKMWKDALLGNEIIKDKIMGDGFGFSRLEMNIMGDQMFGGGPGFIGAGQEEAWIIRGAFHSGPVSSIRFVGYIGFALLLWMQIYLAIYSYKIAKKSLNSRFMPMGIFIGMWCIYNPIEFVAIFGAYNNNFVDILSYAGIARILDNSMQTFSKQS